MTSPLSGIFLCHHSRYAEEISALAQELRLRGVPPWVDREGGFGVGDNSKTEARRVISSDEETFGLLFYATPGVFERPFVTEVELLAAVARKDKESGYILMAVTRGLSRSDLEKQSRLRLGVDFNNYHGASIRDKQDDDINTAPLLPQLQTIARAVLEKWLPQQLSGDAPLVGISFCTRDHLSLLDDDVLDIDACAVVTENSEAGWKRLIQGLRDVKKTVRSIQAKPVIRVQGSKHLTAAFLFGRMFAPATVQELSIRQGDDLWSSRTPFDGVSSPLHVSEEDDAINSRHLFVEITTGRSIRADVRRFVSESGVAPTAYLRFEQSPERSANPKPLDAASACAIARQVADKIIEVVATQRAEKIHLFCLAPQALMMLIGHRLPPTVPVQLYEFDGQNYHASICVNEADFKNGL